MTARVAKLIRKLGGVSVEEESRFTGLNRTEQAFFRAAMRRHGAKAWRAGWPDFLMHTKAHGYIGVEVKAGADKVRPNQVAMFEALELAGIRTFVWHPSEPEKLTPWRKFAALDSARKAQRNAARDRASMARGVLHAELDEQATAEEPPAHVF